jgi:hypothetical protein
MIKIIDNFLPDSYIDAIESLCCNTEMNWNYYPDTVYNSPVENIWNKQFTHTLFVNGNPVSTHATFFMPVMFLLEKEINYKIKNLMRLKINLTTTVPDSKLNFAPHIDAGIAESYLSAVLYINNSDGDTIIYENSISDRSTIGTDEQYKDYLENRKNTEKFVIKQRVEYKRNRLVIFDGSYLHEGEMPTSHKERIVLNAVFN